MHALINVARAALLCRRLASSSRRWHVLPEHLKGDPATIQRAPPRPSIQKALILVLLRESAR